MHFAAVQQIEFCHHFSVELRFLIRIAHSHRIDKSTCMRRNKSPDSMRYKLERYVLKYQNVVTVEIKLLREHRKWECVTQWLAAWIEICCSHDPFTTLTKPKCSRRVRFCCGSALFIFCFAATVIILVRSLCVCASVCQCCRCSLARPSLCSRSLRALSQCVISLSLPWALRTMIRIATRCCVWCDSFACVRERCTIIQAMLFVFVEYG